MFEKKAPDWLRQLTQEDMLAAGVRVALSSTGPFGAIVAEFATEFLPRQRLDRIHDFIEQLNQRVKDLEEQFRSRYECSPSFAALVEETTAGSGSDAKHRTAARSRRDTQNRPRAFGR